MNKNTRLRLHNEIVKQILNEVDTTLKTLQRNRIIRDAYKTRLGCEGCGYDAYACVLQLDHLDPATKFRNSKGDLVEPGNMVYQSTAKMIEEFAKCRVLCANCHAVHTFTVQRKTVMSVADVRLVA
jgi:hypothetical protein